MARKKAKKVVKPKRVYTGYRADARLMKQLKQLALDRETKVQRIIDEAVREYIGEKSA